MRKTLIFFNDIYGCISVVYKESILRNDVVITVSTFSRVLDFHKREVKGRFELQAKHIMFRDKKDNLNVEVLKENLQAVAEELLEDNINEIPKSFWHTTFLETHTIKELVTHERFKPFVNALIKQGLIADEDRAIDYFAKKVISGY